MSADKYPSIFSRQMEAIVYLFRKARPSFFRVLQRMTLVLNVTNLKYGKYDLTSKKKNNNKRLIDGA